MRFLVTGALGFIGASLSRELAQRYSLEKVQLMVPPEARHAKEASRQKVLADAGFDIVECDILSPKDGLLEQVKPFNVLFHLVTFAETETNSKELDQVNDVGIDRFLQKLEPLLPGTRVIFTSSLAAVDRAFPDNSPQGEEYPCTPRTRYGRSKLRGEAILKKHAKETGFDWTILRLPTVFGPNYRPGGLFSLIADSLQKRTLMARLAWPGRIGLVYVDDVVNALIALALHEAGCNHLYHLSSERPDLAPTMDDLIERISRILQIRRSRIQLPKFAWALLRKAVWFPGLLPLLPYKIHNVVWRLSLILTDGLVGNGKKLNAFLPIEFTSLDEGLRATYSSTRSPQFEVPPV